MALVVAYGFSEGSGSTTADLSGNGGILTTQGANAWVATGHSGAGAGDYWTTTSLGPDGLSSWTMMFWACKTGAWTDDQAVVSDNDRTSLGFASDGSLHGSFRPSGSTLAVEPDFTLIDNEWAHIAIVFSGTTFQCYVNGVAAGDSVSTDPPNTIPFNTTFGICGDPDGQRTGGVGAFVLDDFRIFDSVLSPANIGVYMTISVAPTFSGGPIAAWALNEGPGSDTLIDATGHGFDIVLDGSEDGDRGRAWDTGHGSSPYAYSGGDTSSALVLNGNIGDMANNLTFMCWYHYVGPTDARYEALIGGLLGGSGNSSLAFWAWRSLSSDYFPMLLIRGGDEGSYETTGRNAGALDNDWHHVAATYDQSGHVVMYYDGEVAYTDVGVPATVERGSGIGALLQEIAFGDGEMAAGWDYRAFVQDARLFDRILPIEEIRGYMATPVTSSSNMSNPLRVGPAVPVGLKVGQQTVAALYIGDTQIYGR